MRSGSLQQRGDILQVSFRCLLQRGIAGIVGGIRVGAPRQQQADNLEPVLSHGKHQRRAARLVAGIDGRSLIQQRGSLRHVALCDGRIQSCGLERAVGASGAIRALEEPVAFTGLSGWFRYPVARSRRGGRRGQGRREALRKAARARNSAPR